MRTLVLALSAILLSAVTALAQGTMQIVRVGYAVVTPSIPATTGLVVFETFVQTRTQDTLEVGVFPPNLMINALIPVDVNNSDTSTLGVAITNPNNALASITMTLRRSDGTPFSTSSFTISGRRQISRLISEYFPTPPSGGFSATVPLPAEFSGTLTIISTVPVSILGLKFRGLNYSTIPVVDLTPQIINLLPAIVLGVGGLGAALFPQFVIGGGWATEIVILNTTPNILTVRLDLFTADGDPLLVVVNNQTSSSFTNLTVPANGLLTLVPTPVP